MAKLDDQALKNYEEVLLKEKEKAQEIVQEIDRKQKKIIQSSTSNIKNINPTQEDSKSDSFEQEIFFLDQQLEKIQEINTALKRIYEKTFGICEICGNNIQDERLKLVPYASFCIHCKNKAESRSKRRK